MLCDKEMATEILTMEKNLAALYYTATQEARTEPLHCNLKSMMNDALTNQQNTFKILLQKGWYTVKEADKSKITEVKSKYNMAAQ